MDNILTEKEKPFFTDSFISVLSLRKGLLDSLPIFTGAVTPEGQAVYQVCPGWFVC